MGIRDADFHRTESLLPRMATGYFDRDQAEVFRPFAHRPAGALLASADDLAKLVHFVIRRGEGYPPIVSPTGLARIERNGTLPYPRLDTEYGFANYGDVSHPVISRGHDGGSPGFHASLRYFPSLDIGYVVLLNGAYTYRGYFEIRSLLYSYLTQNRVATQVATTAPAVEEPGADAFEYASPRSELFAFIDRARIGWRVSELPGGFRVTELDGEFDDLVPAADGGYRREFECGSSVRFATNDGTPVMVTSYLYAEATPWWFARLRYTAVSVGMFLLRIVPLWAAIVLALGVMQRRRVLPIGLVLWPTLSGLCCWSMGRLFGMSFYNGVIGHVHPLTVALCASTILFAVSAAASLYCAVRWSLRPDRPRLLHRAFPIACSIAAAGLALWFGVNGMIGLRTWAW
jgi:hypothetical protein